jgi:hypothetical protein
VETRKAGRKGHRILPVSADVSEEWKECAVRKDRKKLDLIGKQRLWSSK